MHARRTLLWLTLVLAAAGTMPAMVAEAALVSVSHYRLGESGSVGSNQPFTPLVDSISGIDIPNWNSTITKTSITTTGLAAPGSSAAMVVSGNAGGGGTWFGSSFNEGNGLSDNWVFDFWLRPDISTGSYLGSTDGNQSLGLGLRFWATNTSHSGTSLGGKTLSSGSTYLLMLNGAGYLGSSSSTYTLGQWARVTLIRRGGTVHYYLNEALQDSAATGGLVNDIRLGAGYWASVGSNGGFDELRVYSFDASDSLESVSGQVFAVPEPTAIALLGCGMLAIPAMAHYRCRRNAAVRQGERLTC